MMMHPLRGAVIATLLRISWSQSVLESDEFKAMIDSGDFFAILDVRSKEEFEAGHIPGATLVESLASFGTDQQVSSPEDLQGCEDCTMAVYCQTGNRAAAAIVVLQDAGFSGELFNGQGASNWIAAGFDLVVDPSVDPSCVGNPAVSEECLRGPIASTVGSPFNSGSWATTSSSSSENDAEPEPTTQTVSWSIVDSSWQNRDPAPLTNTGTAANPGNSITDVTTPTLETVTKGTASNPWRVVPGNSWDEAAISSANGDNEPFTLNDRTPFNPSGWITTTTNISSEQNENIDVDETSSAGATIFQWNSGGGTWSSGTNGNDAPVTAAGEEQNDPWNVGWPSRSQGLPTQHEGAPADSSNTNGEEGSNSGSTWITSSSWDSEGRGSESTESLGGTTNGASSWVMDSSWSIAVSNSDTVDAEPLAGTGSTAGESTRSTTSHTWAANSSWATATSSGTSSETTNGSSGSGESPSSSSNSSGNTWNTDSSWTGGTAMENATPETTSTTGVIRGGSPDNGLLAQSDPDDSTITTTTAGAFSGTGSTWGGASSGSGGRPQAASEPRGDSSSTASTANYINLAKWIESGVEAAEPSENSGWGSWTGATNTGTSHNLVSSSSSSRVVAGDAPFRSGWSSSTEQRPGVSISFLGMTSAAPWPWMSLLVSALATTVAAIICM